VVAKPRGERIPIKALLVSHEADRGPKKMWRSSSRRGAQEGVSGVEKKEQQSTLSIITRLQLYVFIVVVVVAVVVVIAMGGSDVKASGSLRSPNERAASERLRMESAGVTWP
jgi:hypothetical protein